MRKRLLLLLLVFSLLLAGCGSPEEEGTATPVADGDEEGADETPTEEGNTTGDAGAEETPTEEGNATGDENDTG